MSLALSLACAESVTMVELPVRGECTADTFDSSNGNGNDDGNSDGNGTDDGNAAARHNNQQRLTTMSR